MGPLVMVSSGKAPTERTPARSGEAVEADAASARVSAFAIGWIFPTAPHSRSKTGLTTLTPVPVRHDGEPNSAAVVVIMIRRHFGHSPTPTRTTSGGPTNSAHMRVGSVSNR